MFTRKALMLVLVVTALVAIASMVLAKDNWSRVIASWPETAKNTAKEIAQKYGDPDMVGSDLLVWKNKGPYLWIQVHRTEVPHNFPVEHKDVLDIAIAYRMKK